jgi:hypothetical protein
MKIKYTINHFIVKRMIKVAIGGFNLGVVKDSLHQRLFCLK